MFLNISNHSYTKWSDSQFETAYKLGGEVMDIPFPNVPPDATSEEVKDIAKNLIAQHLTKISKSNVVMVQGEFSLFYVLVNMLKALRIQTVVATTERKVVENGNTKTTVFEFVQFREV
jgi:NADH:ubiquinone oxidoreductase subunit C